MDQQQPKQGLEQQRLEQSFILNQNDGLDTLHDAAHLSERCNTDQIEGRSRVDTGTAFAMLEAGTAVRCQHCQG